MERTPFALHSRSWGVWAQNPFRLGRPDGPNLPPLSQHESDSRGCETEAPCDLEGGVPPSGQAASITNACTHCAGLHFPMFAVGVASVRRRFSYAISELLAMALFSLMETSSAIARSGSRCITHKAETGFMAATCAFPSSRSASEGRVAGSQYHIAAEVHTELFFENGLDVDLGEHPKAL